MSNHVREGDYVELYHSPNVKFITKAVKSLRIDTIKGFIDLSSIIGLEYGDKVKSSLGYEFIITRPSLEQILLSKFKRVTQVIYPKDAALIIIKTGVGPGSKIVEAGVGSGFMTAILAYYVRPNGKVIGYEKRREFLQVAYENLRILELDKYVELRCRDVVNEGFDIDYEVDAVILDLGDPWNVLEHAYRILRHGGHLAVYVPSINQVFKTLQNLERSNFIDVEVFDVSVKYWKPISNELRPETWMLAHTGYIIICKKP